MMPMEEGGGSTDDVYFQRKFVRPTKRKERIKIGLLTSAVFIIGIIIGYFSNEGIGTKTTNEVPKPEPEHGRSKQEIKNIHDAIVREMKAENIRENLKYLTKYPHAAGSVENNNIIKEIAERFMKYGIEVETPQYDVLLSFPKNGTPNHACLLNATGGVHYKSIGREKRIEDREKVGNPLPPFNAYGPNKTVQGDVVYVNYGRFEDFQELKNNYGINCSGMIVLARYGKIFRGDKVKIAEANGAIGVLLYSDPFDVGPVPDDQLFPNGRWLSRDGIQRGAVGTFDGDALTPGYPAKEWAFKHSKKGQIKGIPNIPVQPISGEDAFNFLSRLGGKRVPDSWRGKLNATYTFGPFNDNFTARVAVYNELVMKQITNVIGTIRGEIEPDRYVLFGNHVDAWTYGAVDPSSGTSLLLETARAIGTKLKTGWKPRRTIKLCAWDGEEHGIIGSSEWVEEFASELRDRAVAYVNVDTAVSGNYSVKANASPLMNDLVSSIMGEVSDPHDKSMTVLQKSTKTYPSKEDKSKVSIGGVGSGSDFLYFYQYIGVPSMNWAYKQTDLYRKYNVGSYPMYHSLHDTFYWMENFVDRNFKCHLTIGRLCAYSLLRLADAEFIPFDLKRYAKSISSDVNTLEANLKKKDNQTNGVNVDSLRSASVNLTQAVQKFIDSKESIKKPSILQVRMINDALMQFEKGFIYPRGLPGRPDIKHYIQAPALHNQYGASAFPAVNDLLYDIDSTKNWNAVKEQLTITTYLIQSVTNAVNSASLNKT